MEFGRVTPEELEQIDFTLPPDKAATTIILKRNKAKSDSRVYIGCAKWGRPDWVGKIYPKGTKAGDFLEHYARQFNSIELNATFYRMPTVKQTSGWAAKVGDNFRFCPKFVDQITHLKRLKDVTKLTDRFLEGISGFGKKLGPVFIMPHPGMGPKTLETLEAFVEQLPSDLTFFVELRHPQWYADEKAFTGVTAMLEKKQTGTVITDASGRRDCLHMRLTLPQAFIRFVGNGLHPTDYQRCDAWINRMKQWKVVGIQNLYFFMHQHEELHSPELCRYLIPRVNDALGTRLHIPAFVTV
jgi:uncharacterized protein YecE (DUF72 family)